MKVAWRGPASRNRGGKRDSGKLGACAGLGRNFPEVKLDKAGERAGKGPRAWGVAVSEGQTPFSTSRSLTVRRLTGQVPPFASRSERVYFPRSRASREQRFLKGARCMLFDSYQEMALGRRPGLGGTQGLPLSRQLAGLTPRLPPEPSDATSTLAPGMRRPKPPVPSALARAPRLGGPPATLAVLLSLSSHLCPAAGNFSSGLSIPGRALSLCRHSMVKVIAGGLTSPQRPVRTERSPVFGTGG